MPSAYYLVPAFDTNAATTAARAIEGRFSAHLLHRLLHFAGADVAQHMCADRIRSAFFDPRREPGTLW